MNTLCCLFSVANLGWASGALVMSSALPNMYRNFREPGSAKPSLLRDAIQCLGNIGWVHYGLLTGAKPIAYMCALSAVFMAILMGQQIWKSARVRWSESL